MAIFAFVQLWKGCKMIITWTIRPLNTPTIFRNCSHCGCKSKFECSGNFRINAQQRKIDVWLIYKCKKCDSTWNMDIFTRVKPETLGSELYSGLLENNAQLAARYAFDASTIAKNKAMACYDDVEYAIEGEDISLEDLMKNQIILQINVKNNLQIRLDKILSEKLGISRTVIKSYFKCGAIKCENVGSKQDISRIKSNITLHFDFPKIHELTDNQYEKA